MLCGKAFAMSCQLALRLVSSGRWKCKLFSCNLIYVQSCLHLCGSLTILCPMSSLSSDPVVSSASIGELLSFKDAFKADIGIYLVASFLAVPNHRWWTVSYPVAWYNTRSIVQECHRVVEHVVKFGLYLKRTCRLMFVLMGTTTVRETNVKQLCFVVVLVATGLDEV